MRRRRRRVPRGRGGVHPLVIAVVAILATVAITYYAFAQSLPFEHHFTLHALVNNSVNVRQDSPVRIAGIDVGVVQGTSPDGDATEINFTMDSNGLPVHTDATMRIRDRLFLEGGYYLDLDPGSPSAPIAKDGFTIPESQTSTPVQFYKLLSTFDVASRTSLESLLNTLNEGFSPQPGHALSDSGAGGFKTAIPQLTPTLKDFAWVSRALRGTQANDVENLLSSAANVFSTLSGSSAQLVDSVTGLNQTSSALAASDGALAQSIAGLDETLQVAPAALTAVDHSLPPVATLALTIDPSLKVAPPILDALTSTVSKFAAAVAPAERGPLIASLKATFSQFPVILRMLASAFPLTKQVSDCLRTHVTPLLKMQVPDGSLSTNEPVWQDFVHFLPTVAGASGSFDANGPYTRVLAGGGTNTLAGLPNLPIVGQLVGSGPPGGGTLQGARPSWVGDLTSADFHPEAPCASQPLPSLASPAAAPDLRSVRTPAAKPLTAARLKRLFEAIRP
jgi:phospholipid/cholesterol/gamma-HCH transport system substrate-binding protein